MTQRLLPIQDFADLTREILEEYQHVSFDEGLVFSLIPRNILILRSGQWLVPVRHILPPWRSPDFLDFIPHSYEEWAKDNYPRPGYRIGEWF